MESIAVRNLSFRYPGATNDTLRGVDFRLEAGDFAVLIGATGSGKSTLLRLLKPELAPLGTRGGEIRVAGEAVPAPGEWENLRPGPEAQRCANRVGYVMQRPEQQIVTDKVWHELAFALENMGLPQAAIRRRVAEMASYFGIADWFERDVHSLSGGQKQLLNLAAVMVAQPEVLLLDEPTSQLDPIAAGDFLNTVKKLNLEMGITVLLIEHRLEEALPMADRVLVLESGELTLDLPPAAACEELRNHPALLHAMPGAVRLFHAAGAKGTCPITVREGRRFLRENYGNEIRSLDSSPAPRPEAKALELRDVYFRYGREQADVLRGLNLDVRAGEILCLLGPNGSGKSTAMKLAAGLIRAYSGDLRIFGRKIRDYKGQSLYRECVSMLPQDAQTVFLKNTVRDELREVGADPKALPYSLDHLMERHPYDLSGGEQQLVALAKVLASKPKLLLLDEPTKGIDANTKRAVRQILRKLRDAGAAILIVTHDVEFAANCADRCALIFRGEIASADAPNRFFDENSFYTTASNRICRGWYDGVATVEDAAELCRRNGNSGAGPEDGAPCGSREIACQQAGMREGSAEPSPRVLREAAELCRGNDAVGAMSGATLSDSREIACQEAEMREGCTAPSSRNLRDAAELCRGDDAAGAMSGGTLGDSRETACQEAETHEGCADAVSPSTSRARRTNHRGGLFRRGRGGES